MRDFPKAIPLDETGTSDAVEAAGFTDVAHVVHGFEGDLNDAFKRSSLNGWRHDGLPWEQM